VSQVDRAVSDGSPAKRHIQKMIFLNPLIPIRPALFANNKNFIRNGWQRYLAIVLNGGPDVSTKFYVILTLNQA
jgi:hypothetical protein